MTEGASRANQKFTELLRRMYGRPEFHYPIVSAQLQFRLRYYGLSGAAMLEDLFFDALSNFVRMHAPHESLARPPRGEKGFDYTFNGTPMSHKVSKRGPETIAALWDPTKSEITHWSFETSICFTSGGYQPSRIRATLATARTPLTMQPLSSWQASDKQEAAALVHWPTEGQVQVLQSWMVDSSSETSVSDRMPFAKSWRSASVAHASGIPANELEILLFPRRVLADLSPGVRFAIDEDILRPGIFLFDHDWLQNVPVKPNNRGLLVAKEFVRNAMVRSRREGLHVPLSDWFSAYSGDKPPDLYLAQRSEYDLMFSKSQPSLAVTVDPVMEK